MKNTSSEEEERARRNPPHYTINGIFPDNNDHYGVKMKINGKKQIHHRHRLTIMPYNRTRHSNKGITPPKEIYQDVNWNEMKFLGKIWVNTEYNKISVEIIVLITKRNGNPLLLGVN